MKRIALIITCLLTASLAFAQSTLKGKVMENHTDIQLSGITVENQTDHTKTQTDPFGNFTIKAKKGDLLCFSGLNYIADTVYLINLKNLTVLLELRSNQLKEVKVTSLHMMAKSGWSAPPQTGPFGSHTVLYKPGGGFIVKLMGGGGSEKKRKKQEQLEVNGQREREIARVFNPANVKNYVPLTGQELTNFVIKYTPGIDTYYNSKFNLVLYLSDSYKGFLTIPEDKRKSPTYFQLNGEAN
jgi:hypothetical protein